MAEFAFSLSLRRPAVLTFPRQGLQIFTKSMAEDLRSKCRPRGICKLAICESALGAIDLSSYPPLCRGDHVITVGCTWMQGKVAEIV